MENEFAIKSVSGSLSALEVYVPQVQKGTQLIKNLPAITGADSLQMGLDILKKGKSLLTLIGKGTDTLCEPLRGMKAEIDAVQKNIKQRASDISFPIVEAIDALEKEILQFQKEEKARETRQREQAERIRRLNEEAERHAQEREKFASLPPESTLHFQQANTDNSTFVPADVQLPPTSETVPAMQIEPPVISATKVAGARVIWKAELIDEDQVPREYCSPNMVKINASLKLGIREIPGVKIWADEKIGR